MKKLFALLLVLCLLVPVISLNAEEARLKFNDVKETAWYADAVGFCYVNSVMNGRSDTVFDPKGLTTREQMVTVLFNISGDSADGIPGCQFTDVSQSAWYTPYVNWAVERGYTSGISETLFGVGKALSRQEAVTLLYNFTSDRAEGGADLSTFGDADTVADWAYNAFAWAVENSVIKGNNGNLKPRDSITRAELAQMLTGYLKNILYAHCQHDYSEEGCTVPSVCKLCGLVKGLPKGHLFPTLNCDTPSECVNCGMFMAPKGHSYREADCVTPMTCTVCNKTTGDPLGHTTDKGVCQRCKKEIFANKYDKFAYYMTNAGMTDGSIKYLHATVSHTDGAVSDQYVKYDTASGKGYFEIYYRFAKSDHAMKTVIDFEGIAGGYRAICSYYINGTEKYSGIAYLVPSAFRYDTSLNMTTFKGDEKNRDQFKELFCKCLIFDLDGADRLLWSINMSASDFGFTAFK